ncbi:MAG: ABC transporter ATP-binding protein [Burkholderiaceae bacterium]
MNAATVLRVEGLSVDLETNAGWLPVLNDLAFVLEAGKTFALVGESGCGKSMTALALARLLPDAAAIVAGRVELRHKFGNGAALDLLALPECALRAVRGKRIAMIFQEPGTSLNPVLTVGRQIIEVLEAHGIARGAAARARALDWLARVGLDRPQDRLQQYPFQLSGGQKQRVMIALALAAEPDVLIADEPTTALDVSLQAQVLALLRSLQQSLGMAMLLITHDLNMVRDLADHVALMYAGQIVESAPVADFFAAPCHPYAHALLAALPSAALRGRDLHALPGQVPPLNDLPTGCRFAPRCLRADEHCRTVEPVFETAERSTMQNGVHRFRCFRPYRAEETAAPHDAQTFPASPLTGEAGMTPPVLDVRALTVAYRVGQSLMKKRVVPVLHGLDLQLWAGRTVALVGESGSGKTTAAKALLQLLDETATVDGEVLLHGQPMRHAKAVALQDFRRQVQVVFQDPFASLNPRHRIRQILAEGLTALCPRLNAAECAARLLAVLDSVGLPATALDKFPHEFSGGQRQRIAIARALAVEPQVLVCDEPTSALDVSVQAQILNLLKKLQRERGLAYLFITHNLAVVEYLADEVVVLRHGTVVERGGVAAVFGAPKDPYTRQLLQASGHFTCAAAGCEGYSYETKPDS